MTDRNLILENQALKAALLRAAEKCDRWAEESAKGGWSTHQVEQNKILAAELRAMTKVPAPSAPAIPEGFTREEIQEMLSIVRDEPQTVDGGGEWGPQESTDGWYTRLLRAILAGDGDEDE